MPNGRAPRQHDFFFSPRDYLNDPSVLAMGTLARGAYSTLLFALWDQPEPGISPGSDAVLCTLARTTTAEWLEVRDQVAAAFDLSARPGYWVQKRMVYEHGRQSSFHDLRSRLGKAGRDKQLSGRARAEPGVSPGASPATLASPAPPAESKSTDLPICDGRTDGSATDHRAEWDEGFLVGFWIDYPRKVKKRDALKAWRSLKPWTQAHLDAICAGLEKWRDYWRSHGTELDKIPYPATFLRAAQHEGDPQ